jgi:peptidoglycan L-alanyl-D-glutamate endopeptidase CwlK
VTKGVSWTMKSRHLTYPSQAVDIAPYPLDWGNIDRFKEMAAVVFKCAALENVELEWGGNWEKHFDGPHFQLPKGA